MGKRKHKTIITVALSGSQGSKNKNPHTPVTADEMIEDAYQCYLQGASIVHVHTKADDQETYAIDYEKIQYIREEINKKCDMIVNITTSGEVSKVNDLELMGTLDTRQEKRSGVLDLKPEIASFDVPTMNFGEKVFINPVSYLRKAGKKMQENNILPEVEIFTMADIETSNHLIADGYLNANPYYQLCLGIRGGTPATVKNLVHLKDELPQGANWSAFGIGKNHLPIMYTTLALGGNIRVGLEDNLYYSKGELTTNVELVKRAARVIKEFGNEPSTPNEAREILGII